MPSSPFIQITRDFAERLWQKHNPDEPPPAKFMLAIRGVTPSEAPSDSVVATENRPGYNNDAVGLVLGQQVRLWPGTVDAGSMAQLGGGKNDSKGGVFHLRDGVHNVRRHPHLASNGAPPKGLDSRAAWRVTTPPSDSEARGWRDKDDNDVLSSGDVVQATSVAINVHWGAKLRSAGPVKTPVGTMSEGCLNVIFQYWLAFRDLSYSNLGQKGKLLLVDAKDVADMQVALPALRLMLNGKPLDVDLWEVPPGKTMAYVRPVLDRVAVSGKPCEYSFQSDPPRLEFSHPAGRTLRLTMKQEGAVQRGTAGIRDLFTALDPAADVRRSADARTVEVVSAVVV